MFVIHIVYTISLTVVIWGSNHLFRMSYARIDFLVEVMSFFFKKDDFVRGIRH